MVEISDTCRWYDLFTVLKKRPGEKNYINVFSTHETAVKICGGFLFFV